MQDFEVYIEVGLIELLSGKEDFHAARGKDFLPLKVLPFSSGKRGEKRRSKHSTSGGTARFRPLREQDQLPFWLNLWRLCLPLLP